MVIQINKPGESKTRMILAPSMFKPPKVGERFLAGFKGTKIFWTSVVTEVISKGKFKTINSTYEWKILEK